MALADDKEIRRLGELILYPIQYQERRTERLRFHSESRFAWEIEQQIALPHISDVELYSSPCRAIISLGIYPKIRIPDLSAYSPNGEHIAVLSRPHRTFALAIAITDHSEVDRALELGLVGQEDYLAIIHEIADLLGSRPDICKAKISYLSDKVHSDLPVCLPYRFLLRSCWGELQDRLGKLADFTHVLAVVPGEAGRRVVVRHVFTQEIVELRTPVPLGRAADLSVGQSRWWRFANRLTTLLPLSLRNALARVAQGLCLYPTSLQIDAGNADHCRSYYFLVDPLPGISVEEAYWQDYRPDSSDDSYGADAYPTVLAYHRDAGSLGGHHGGAEKNGRFYIDTRSDTNQFVAPFGICSVFAFMALLLAHRDWLPSGNVQALLGGATLIPGALLTWLLQTRPSLKSISARFLRVAVYAVAVVSLGVGFALLLNTQQIPHWSWFDRSRILAGGFGLAVFVSAIIALTFRKANFDNLSASACCCEVIPVRKRLLMGNLAMLAVALTTIIVLVLFTGLVGLA